MGEYISELARELGSTFAGQEANLIRKIETTGKLADRTANMSAERLAVLISYELIFNCFLRFFISIMFSKFIDFGASTCAL